MASTDVVSGVLATLNGACGPAALGITVAVNIGARMLDVVQETQWELRWV